MVRILGPFIGLFFALGALWAFANGAIADAPVLAQYGHFTAPTAETVFHKEPEALRLQSDGPFGTWNKEQLQRGFAVYDNVCKACHSLSHVSFRDLEQIGYSEAEVKAIAKTYQVPHYNAATGEVATADGKPTDHFPPVVYAGQGSPPDLSLITKAREGGAAYVHSLLTGYADQAGYKNDKGQELLKMFPDIKTPDGLHFNPYFANLNIAMPPPLTDDAVTYSDGTKATVDQEAQDVAAFLTWTAEPSLVKRHQVGWAVLGFLLFATVLAYMSKRTIWAEKEH
ncbi:MAG: cytochrome c1 [Sphingomonadales bacterium]|nr:cytochrome c1 [Sphingomonadales bacterium]MDE2569182.1 cytochrome c1 [Sphingomonadales bacterium]